MIERPFHRTRQEAVHVVFKRLDPSEAEPLLQQVLTINENALGLDHPHVAVILSNLASLHLSQRKLAEAQRITGVSEKAALVREGLRALIEREAARRLARLGATEPQLEPVPRRRSGRT